MSQANNTYVFSFGLDLRIQIINFDLVSFSFLSTFRPQFFLTNKKELDKK